MAFATTWIGMAMEVEQTEEKAPRNFLASHSAGRLSCLSTSKTLLEENTNGMMTDQMLLYWAMK